MKLAKRGEGILGKYTLQTPRDSRLDRNNEPNQVIFIDHTMGNSLKPCKLLPSCGLDGLHRQIRRQ